jgi:hypothetical protein
MTPQVDFPASIQQMMVAGNVLLPDRTRNAWNQEKSRNLLRFYGEEEEVTDGEGEYGPSARVVRLRVTAAQLNSAQMLQ